MEESVATWERLAALPPEENPYADEAAFRAIQLKQYLEIPPPDQKARLERIAEELRNYADAHKGKWREIALHSLAWLYQRLERADEAVAIWESFDASQIPAALPCWLRLVRKGDVFSGYVSADGNAWTSISEVETESPAQVLVGLAVTSRNTEKLCTVTFDEVQLVGEEAPSWRNVDVGSVEKPGGMELSEGTFTVRGNGTNIWEKADGFHYVYRECAGDCEIVARMLTQENTHGWARAGVMIREDLDADAPHVSVFVTSENGADMQHRASKGGRTRSWWKESKRLRESARSNIKGLRAREKLKPGNPAIAFSAVTLSGERVNLSQFRGSVVLLDFWATWYGPCLEELPVIKSLHESFRDKGLVVLGVSKDKDVEKLKRFLRDEGISWKQIVDSEQEQSLADLYQVMGIPCAFLIDREGTIRERYLAGERLEFAVKEFFGLEALRE